MSFQLHKNEKRRTLIENSRESVKKNKKRMQGESKMKNGMVTIKRSNKLGVGEHLVEINSIDYKKSSKSGLKLVQIEVQCVKTKREGIFLFPLSSNSNYPLSDQLIDAIYIDENKDEIDGDELEGKRIIIRVVSKKGYLNIESFKSRFEYSEDEFDDYNNENHDELNDDKEWQDAVRSELGR